MRKLHHLLEKNRRWAEGLVQKDPEHFHRLVRQQKPHYLWIGCSDSRVPANVIVDLPPGELFVHRNVANVVVHTDLNCLSVIQYAVEVLGVEHIIVCGHYGCGGVLAAIDGREHGLIDNWLRHIKDVYFRHRNVLDFLPDLSERADRLCELSVKQQVANVCHTTVVQNAWKAGRELVVHGWIYRLSDGIIRDLGVSVAAPAALPDIYRVEPDK
ncbi:carbonate dehydratase [bacterium]|nr:carbonate dehydratase [bacterium]